MAALVYDGVHRELLASISPRASLRTHSGFGMSPRTKHSLQRRFFQNGRWPCLSAEGFELAFVALFFFPVEKFAKKGLFHSQSATSPTEPSAGSGKTGTLLFFSPKRQISPQAAQQLYVFPLLHSRFI